MEIVFDKKRPRRCGVEGGLIVSGSCVRGVPMLPWGPGATKTRLVPHQTNLIWVDREAKSRDELLIKPSLVVSMGKARFKSLGKKLLESFLEITKFGTSVDVFFATSPQWKSGAVVATVSPDDCFFIALAGFSSVPIQIKLNVLVEKLLGFFLF